MKSDLKSPLVQRLDAVKQRFNAIEKQLDHLEAQANLDEDCAAKLQALHDTLSNSGYANCTENSYDTAVIPRKFTAEAIQTSGLSDTRKMFLYEVALQHKAWLFRALLKRHVGFAFSIVEALCGVLVPILVAADEKLPDFWGVDADGWAVIISLVGTIALVWDKYSMFNQVAAATIEGIEKCSKEMLLFLTLSGEYKGSSHEDRFQNFATKFLKEQYDCFQKLNVYGDLTLELKQGSHNVRAHSW